MFSRNFRKILVSSFKNSRILNKSECCGIDVSSQFLEDCPNMDIVDKDFPILRNMIISSETILKNVQNLWDIKINTQNKPLNYTMSH